MKATLLINEKWCNVPCKSVAEIEYAVIVTIERNYKRIYDAFTGLPISGEFHKDYLKDEIECIKTYLKTEKI